MDEQDKDEDMVFMVPDILVARTEQVRRLIKDMSKADEEQKLFLKQALILLLESCDPKLYRLNQVRHDNVTSLN